ncbi:4-(cytidine 5'-diphospho)-2-C-methyl-D-erythritol kinase [Alphaproteobacteria bacterium]|nr:4-(cytidine 5'-diphospho)-2-C-methyl-D-erythritol kinase [Alphaproteobacteria bacterium]
MSELISFCAPAKINLSLRVRGKLDNGYHALESLVAFAAFGDTLSVQKSDETRFTSNMETQGNLVLRAHNALQKASGRTLPTHMHLDKKLPIAAGLGGGSSDAGACLRGLMQLHQVSADALDLPALALSLGADVPVCLSPQPAWMTGIGEQITPLGGLPACDIVLVNPRLGLSTQKVFETLQAGALQSASDGPPVIECYSGLIGFVERQGNDLQAPAMALLPQIADCLEALSKAAGDYVAMSGSGATCFALCEAGGGQDVAQAYRQQRPEDWVVAAPLVSAENAEIDQFF